MKKKSKIDLELEKNISKRLQNSHKEVEQSTTEVQLQDRRHESEQTLIENLLKSRRQNEQEMTTEARLNSSKSKLGSKFRDDSTYKGNLPKLEEQRIMANKKKVEDYESSSEYIEPLRWWEKSKNHNLKLASLQKKADIDEWEDDEEDEINEEDMLLPSERGQGLSDWMTDDEDFDTGESTEMIDDKFDVDEIEEEDYDEIEEYRDELEDFDDVDDSDIISISNHEFQTVDQGGTQMVSGTAKVDISGDLSLDEIEGDDMILESILNELRDNQIDANVTSENLFVSQDGDDVTVRYYAPVTSEVDMGDAEGDFDITDFDEIGDLPSVEDAADTDIDPEYADLLDEFDDPFDT